LIKYKPDLAEKSAKSGLVLHYPAKLTFLGKALFYKTNWATEFF